MPIQVAKALRLELRVEEDAWRQVARALRDQRTLLVLDDLITFRGGVRTGSDRANAATFRFSPQAGSPEVEERPLTA